MRHGFVSRRIWQCFGETPLMLAVQHDSMECVAALVSQEDTDLAAANVSTTGLSRCYHHERTLLVGNPGQDPGIVVARFFVVFP